MFHFGEKTQDCLSLTTTQKKFQVSSFQINCVFAFLQIFIFIYLSPISREHVLLSTPLRMALDQIYTLSIAIVKLLTALAIIVDIDVAQLLLFSLGGCQLGGVTFAPFRTTILKPYLSRGRKRNAEKRDLKIIQKFMRNCHKLIIVEKSFTGFKSQNKSL